MSGKKLNDYAKFGVWPDAHYMSANQFRQSGFAGVAAVASERDKMLVGDPRPRASQREGPAPESSCLPTAGRRRRREWKRGSELRCQESPDELYGSCVSGLCISSVLLLSFTTIPTYLVPAVAGILVITG